jgi:hypothetical protein
MAFTYSKLAEVTVGSGGTSAITFNNIPQNYTDLVVKLSVRGDNNTTTQQMYLTFNSTTSGYSARQLYGTGSGTASDTLSNSGAAISIVNTNTSVSTANTFSSTDVYIPNYSGSTNKSTSADSVTENNDTTALAGLNAGLWSNVTAITSMRFAPQGGTVFVQHSTATLYGVKAEV